MRFRVMLVAAGLVGLTFLASACGGGKSKSSAIATPDSSGMVEVIARDVKFVPDKITVQAGEMVTLRMKNEDAQVHDFQVKELMVEVMAGGATGAEHEMTTPMPGMETTMPGMETSTPGAASSGEMGPLAIHTVANGEDSVMFIARDKGTYEFWCTQSGHADSGMVGTLTVE